MQKVTRIRAMDTKWQCESKINGYSVAFSSFTMSLHTKAATCVMDLCELCVFIYVCVFDLFCSVCPTACSTVTGGREARKSCQVNSEL